MHLGHRFQRLAAPILVLLVSGCAGAGLSSSLPAATGGPGAQGALSTAETVTRATAKATSAPTATPAPSPSPTPVTYLVGAYVNPDPSASPGLSSIASLQHALGRTLNYDLHFYPITYSYPGSDLDYDAAAGLIPIISLKCGTYSNAGIASGQYDSEIDAMANALAGYKRTVLVRYLWEMNSSLVSEDRTACAGPDDSNGYFNASDFIAAWDHLRARFLLDGATNVKWFWCPNDDISTLGQYFPGRSQLDYVGVDLYDRPSETYGVYVSHFKQTYSAVEDLGAEKPFIVGETGATSSEQVSFFQGLPSLYAAMPAIKAWIYFDAGGSLGNWEVQPDTVEFTAFRNVVAE